MTGAGRRRAAQTFAWPVVMAMLTVAGLAAGLIGSGAFDWVATLCLAVPASIGLRKLGAKSKASPAERR